MDEERADRIVAALRARGVMAHLAQVGVYQCGVRIVLADGGEAVWDTDGVLGLEAEVLEDGVLIGYVPHVEGSEDFTEEQLVEAIAATEYSKEGLHPPTDARASSDRPGPAEDPSPDLPTNPPRPEGPPTPSHRGPRRRWWSRP